MSVAALDRLAVKAPGLPVAQQIARREGVRILRHPVMWVGAILSLAFFGLLTWQEAPVLHRDDTNLAGALLPLAAATMIVTNLAATRSARHGTEELYEGTATSDVVRTSGHLLSVTFAIGAAITLAGVMFVYMLVGDPVGTPRVAEVLGGIVNVALLGVLGIALGRWKAHPALGPLAVVVIVALEVLLIQPIIGLDGTNAQTATRIPWFAPWIPLSITSEVPSEFVIRPSSWHLLYLAGLTAVVAALALARHRLSPSVIGLLLAGVVGTVVGGIGQLSPPAPAQRAALAALVEHPEDHQVCRERRGVTYCAYPAYAPWIDRWARPIEGALDRIPPEERPEGLVVRQTFGTYFEGPIDVPEATVRKAERVYRQSLRAEGSTPIWTGTHWGRGETEGEYEIGLALHVAMEAVDFPSTRQEMRLTDSEAVLVRKTMLARLPQNLRARAERRLSRGRAYYCTSLGQARALAALWIAAQATPATRATTVRVAGEDQYGLDVYENDGKRFAYYAGPFMPLYPLTQPPMLNRIQFTDAEFHYAARLLQDPSDDVAAVFARRWDDMVDPTASTTDFLDELDLVPHPTIAEQIAALPDDVKLEKGSLSRRGGAVITDSIPCF